MYKDLSENIRRDVKEFTDENDIFIEDYNKLTTEDILKYYLGWNGIIGYTNDIKEICEKGGDDTLIRFSVNDRADIENLLLKLASDLPEEHRKERESEVRGMTDSELMWAAMALD